MPMINTPQLVALARFLDVNAYRHSLITSNLANIDTPGYRTRDINFAAELQRIQDPLSSATFTPVSRPVEGLIERPDANNVSLERESLLLAETQLRYRIGVELIRAEFRRLSMAINDGKAQ